jgi:D-alanine-D-alanine ligase
MTYDLRADYIAAGWTEEDAAEFDSIATIQYLEGAIAAEGHQTDRIGNIFALTGRLAQGDRWDLVFNIAEGVGGFGREAQIPALLDAYGIPYVFSDPLVCALTLHKGMTKRVLRDLGLPTPDFFLVGDAAACQKVDLPYPLFAKPVAEGTSKGIGADAKIASRADLEPTCRRLLERYREPVLVERYLPGREVTVGILGTGSDARVAGVLEVILLASAEPDVYTYANKEECESRVEYRVIDGPLADEAGRLAIAAWTGIGCRDGGRVDLRCAEDGSLQILELNPLPGLHPSHSDLPIMCALRGMEYQDLIGRILASATSRLDASSPRLPRPLPSSCGS